MAEENKTKELKKWTQEELDKVLDDYRNVTIGSDVSAKLDLSYSDLRGLCIAYQHLCNVDFTGSNLSCIRIYHSKLDHCHFINCDLNDVIFKFTSIIYSDFNRCNMRNMHCSHIHIASSCVIHNSNIIDNIFFNSTLELNLDESSILQHNWLRSDANLIRPKLVDFPKDAFVKYANCPTHGKFIGWKKCEITPDDRAKLNDTAFYCLVKLEIPASAKRSSGIGFKCRADKAKVLSICTLNGETKLTEALSMYDSNFVYKVGETVSVDDFDDSRWNECAPGIHFFIDKDAAIGY